MAVPREVSWAEGTGSGATPPGPASRGWPPRRGLSRLPEGAEVEDRCSQAFCPRCRALFPCAASLQCPDQQQREAAIQGTPEPARSAPLSVNAGKSRRQIPPATLDPSINPLVCTFWSLFLQKPAINPVQISPELCQPCQASPTASLPRGSGRDGEFLAGPFPGRGTLHFNE